MSQARYEAISVLVEALRGLRDDCPEAVFRQEADAAMRRAWLVPVQASLVEKAKPRPGEFCSCGPDQWGAESTCPMHKRIRAAKIALADAVISAMEEP